MLFEIKYSIIEESAGSKNMREAKIIFTAQTLDQARNLLAERHSPHQIFIHQATEINLYQITAIKHSRHNNSPNRYIVVAASKFEAEQKIRNLPGLEIISVNFLEDEKNGIKQTKDHDLSMAV